MGDKSKNQKIKKSKNQTPINEVPKNSQPNNAPNNGKKTKQHQIPNNKSKAIINWNRPIPKQNPFCVLLLRPLLILLPNSWNQVGNNKISHQKNRPTGQKRDGNLGQVFSRTFKGFSARFLKFGLQIIKIGDIERERRSIGEPRLDLHIHLSKEGGQEGGGEGGGRTNKKKKKGHCSFKRT